MTPISKDKTYKTRDGREVRIYATDGEQSYPIHGAVRTNGAWLLQCWTPEGCVLSHGKPIGCDLIEVKPRIKGWVNVYPPEHGRGERASVVHASRERADKCAGANRIACVPIDAAEGEGL